ncbi:MAG: META domain-containing protein [Propionicimonas sp.]
MRKYWIVAVGLLATLAACSSPTPAAPAGPTLDGTSWVVTAINQKPTLADHQPTITFAGDRAAGLASCNQFSAGFSQTASTVKVTQGATTAMACTPEAVMTQEQAFSAALAATAAVRAAGGGAELLDASGKVVMSLQPAPVVAPKPLEGTTWQLSGIIANEAVSSPIAGTTVTMQISGGQLSGKACNTFRGDATVAGSSFTAGPLMSTKMACPNAAENAQETAVLTILQTASTYAISGNTLTFNAEDGTGLEFRAA